MKNSHDEKKDEMWKISEEMKKGQVEMKKWK